MLPGVLSGTAVVEDVMMKRLKQLTGRLHTLTIERDEAADMLASLVKAMPKPQFQQLQVGVCSCVTQTTSLLISQQAYNYL